jgi:anhydro-N-acetylmuramic acid kinase
LVPAFHHWLFHAPTRDRAVVNIGGIANITYIPANGPVIGFDTGPGNTLLDQWVHEHKNEPYDKEGQWGASGTVSDTLLKLLLRDPYFDKPHPKSTGRERFNLGWLNAALLDLGESIPAANIQATLMELTASSIARHVRRLNKVDEIFVCGGGTRNTTLMRRLESHAAGIPVQTTETLGLHPDWVEACAFAWLAHQRLENTAGNIPSVTGATHPCVLGGVYAG